MIVFDVEHFIEEEELKDELTVGDRIGKPQMCPWYDSHSIFKMKLFDRPFILQDSPGTL
jgi:hypothetical protein